MISVRHDGKSIPDISRSVLGGKIRILFLTFIWITLIFIIAVFAIAAAKSFIADPRIVIPAFGLIPLAMFFSWLNSRLKIHLALSTAIALACFGAMFWLGTQYPIALPFGRSVAMQIWIGILMVYSLVAAVLPVWVLLQPRDYLAYWILAVGMTAGFLGLFVTHKPIVAPFSVGVFSSTQGPIWPMLFILVACGAISGFHSLVSSGTTGVAAEQVRR